MTPEDKAALIELVERLRTQDSRCTSHPVFLVQSKESHGGMEVECADAVCWIDADGEVASAEEHERLEALWNESEEPDGWTNGDGELRIYADSAYRNPELQLLRRVLPLIVESWKTEHGKEINNPS